MLNFNPRSPHGERHDPPVVFVPHAAISTHAPRTGSDQGVAAVLQLNAAFQPTLPARGATAAEVPSAVLAIFQPTLPARGATHTCSMAVCRALISTHAPRTGSDVTRRNAPPGVAISTHAPRTGSDAFVTAASLMFAVYFNPRSPHGERPIAGRIRLGSLTISTHAPRTGSDFAERLPVSLVPISTHAPRTGSDAAKRVLGLSVDISTHAPRTGSDTRQRVTPPNAKGISTHAPRTGSDGFTSAAEAMDLHFNPRSPHGERQATGRGGITP